MAGDNWPAQPEILETEITQTELSGKKIKAMITKDSQPDNQFIEEMNQRHPYWKLMRITGWIRRFKNNCRGHGTTGPLTTEELNEAEQQWIHLIQTASRESPKDIETIIKEGTIMVKSLIPGYTPILLPQRGEFTRRVIEYYHIKTLHGGVTATMSKIREKFWILKL